MKIKKTLKFARDNYLVSIFVALIIFVGFVAAFKIVFSKPTYIYVRVKLGQGLWWAATSKPSIWLVKSIKKGEIEYDLLGNPLAEVTEVRYYPMGTEYNTYLTVKLRASQNKRTKKYVFKRSVIAVGAPVDFEFPSSQITGTVVAINNKPFEDKYVDKIVHFYRRLSYPWQYDNIKIGDRYFDGQDTVFEVLDKSLEVIPSGVSFTDVVDGEESVFFSNARELVGKVIFIKAKLKLKQTPGNLIYGEEYNVNAGGMIGIQTSDYNYEGFTIAKIE